jgi:hypothetical protein
LNISFERYKKCRPNGYKIPYGDNLVAVINYMAIEMATSTVNNLVLNFYKRFNKYVKERFPEVTKEERYNICRSLYEKKYDGDNHIVLHFRNILNDQVPNETNVKKDPTPILNVYYEMLKFAEPLRKMQQNEIQNNDKKTRSPNNKRTLKTFTLLPQKCGFKMIHITIDNSVLADLILGERLLPCRDGYKKNHDDRNMTKQELRKDIKEQPRKYWEQFFDIKKYEKGKRTFRIIKTDGKTASICLHCGDKIKTHKKKVSKKTKKTITTYYNFESYEVVKACDPGYKYLTTTVDKDDNIYQYSSKQYYHEAGTNKTKFQRNKCYERNPAFCDYKAYMPSPKTASIDVYMVYVQYALKGLENALEVHYKNPFRKWRFRDYIKKRKTFHRLCLTLSDKTKINEDKKVLFGMGDWSNLRDCIIKGYRRGPVKALTKELKRYCEVVSVPEHNTSRCCCCCHAKNDKPKKYRVFSCSNCQNAIDRDQNAVKNIYMVMERHIKGINLPESFNE